jgi:hypothetical protein
MKISYEDFSSFKLVCRLNAIPIKIPTGLFGRRW